MTVCMVNSKHIIKALYERKGSAGIYLMNLLKA